MLSPTMSLGTSVMAPVPSPLPCRPCLKCCLLPFPPGICRSPFLFGSVLLLRRHRLLRLVAVLPGVIVLVVIAFLVEPAPAHRKLALPRQRIGVVNANVIDVVAVQLRDLPLVRHVGLSFEYAQLLLVGLWSLHAGAPWS